MCTLCFHSLLNGYVCSGSRKRRAEEDGPSVESTDTEEDFLSSAQTSAVPSPSPSLTYKLVKLHVAWIFTVLSISLACSGETDIEAIQARKQWKKAIMLVWRHAAQHK